MTSTDTCSKAHAHTRPYRKCIISIDLYCSHRCYSYKISHLSQSKTKTYWCTVKTAPTPYLLTSLPCHTSLLCSSSNLSQACSTFHLSLFTGLFYAPSVTCHSSVLCPICHFSQASSMPYLSLATGLFYAPSVTCHSSVLCPICHFSQASSMPHLSLVTVLFYAPSVTCHRPVLCSICHFSQACPMLHLLPVCRPVSCSISRSVVTKTRICHSS